MIYAIMLLMALSGPNNSIPACGGLSPDRAAPVGGFSFGSIEMGCIYMARNKVNGKRYIGQTICTMEKRRFEHENSARAGVVRPFYAAMRKYGFDSFEWKVLFHDVDQRDLYSVEQRLIVLMKTKAPNGYNLTDGGPGNAGHNASDETRRKLSESHKGQKPAPKSEEGKKAIAAANRKRGMSLQTRKKIAEAVSRLWGDEEYQARQITIRLGKKAHWKTRVKMSVSQEIRQRLPEVKAKLSKARMGNQNASGPKGWETRRARYGSNGIEGGCQDV
jgi:group I intron endonuclease